jgi:hypothetical protein
MVIFRITIKTKVNTMNAHSTTHKFRSKGINFRKIKSEMKAIIAAKKQRPTNNPFIPFWIGSCCGGLNNISAAITRQPDVTIFKGVSFKIMSF